MSLIRSIAAAFSMGKRKQETEPVAKDSDPPQSRIRRGPFVIAETCSECDWFSLPSQSRVAICPECGAYPVATVGRHEWRTEMYYGYEQIAEYTAFIRRDASPIGTRQRVAESAQRHEWPR